MHSIRSGINFCLLFLVPAALKFFIAYGADVVEPFWSFNQYFDFVAALIFATGIAFQIPIIQIVLGLFGIISGQNMLSAWKYVSCFINNYCCDNNTIYGPIDTNYYVSCFVSTLFRWCRGCNFIKKINL